MIRFLKQLWALLEGRGKPCTVCRYPHAPCRNAYLPPWIRLCYQCHVKLTRK